MTEKNGSCNRLKINKPFWETLKSTNKKQNELRASDPIGYLTAIGYNCKIKTIKNMMHTTKMTANGCETIERKRMTGKMDHVIG